MKNLHHPDYSTRRLNPHRLAAVRKYAGEVILDVGCGNGAYVLFLSSEFKIKGTDHKSFDAWNERPELFSVSDAQSLDLPGGSVDTIVSFETLEHLPNPQRALVEYFRVCRKNLILTVPNCSLTQGMKRSGIIFNHWIDRTHVNFWGLDDICQLITDVGFRVQHKELINKINMGEIVAESLGLRGRLARVVSGSYRRLQRYDYHMTSLVVASKT